MTDKTPLLKYAKAEDCPDYATHTACPRGYLAWHGWAHEKAKTHKSTRCPTCGFYGVWIPKTQRKAKA